MAYGIMNRYFLGVYNSPGLDIFCIYYARLKSPDAR